jgi:hypothetical protein
MNIKGMKLKVEKGIPVPPAHARNKPETLRELFKAMKPGESVKIPSKNWGIIGGTAVSVWGKGNSATRANGTGIRVWRLK